MTSNLGTEYVRKGGTLGFLQPKASDEDRDAHDKIEKALKGAFRPEFLNRVDDIVLFHRLTLPQIEKIVDLQVEELRRRLAERGTTLELTEEARRLIAEHGYDPVYGARPLRRYLAHELETRIGRALLSGELREGAVIRVDGRAGELRVSFAPEPARAS